MSAKGSRSRPVCAIGWRARDRVHRSARSDGQHLPDEIGRFFAAAAATEGRLFVGTRMNDVREMPFVRRKVNRYMSRRISRLCGQDVPDTQCGYRMVRRDTCPAFPRRARAVSITKPRCSSLPAARGSASPSVPISTIYSDEVSSIHPVRDTVRFLQTDAALRKRFLGGDLTQSLEEAGPGGNLKIMLGLALLQDRFRSRIPARSFLARMRHPPVVQLLQGQQAIRVCCWVCHCRTQPQHLLRHNVYCNPGQRITNAVTARPMLICRSISTMWRPCELQCVWCRYATFDQGRDG